MLPSKTIFGVVNLTNSSPMQYRKREGLLNSHEPSITREYKSTRGSLSRLRIASDFQGSIDDNNLDFDQNSRVSFPVHPTPNRTDSLRENRVGLFKMGVQSNGERGEYSRSSQYELDQSNPTFAGGNRSSDKLIQPGILIHDERNRTLIEKKIGDVIQTDIFDGNVNTLSFQSKVSGLDLEVVRPTGSVFIPGGADHNIRLLALGIVANMVLAVNNRNDKPGVQLESESCLDHDLDCSISGIPRNFLGVDILDCCVKHDIDLWCTAPSKSLTGAHTAVISCVLSKTLNAWYSWTLVVPFLFTIVAAITAAIVALLNSFNLLEQEYPYKGGGYGWSCLCGGKKQTYCCDPSRNPALCLDAQGKRKGLCCYKCSNKCVYDKEGTPIRVETRTDPTGEMECCRPWPRKMSLRDCPV